MNETIETIVMDYMESHMTVPVYMEMPVNDSKEFIVLEKTGSGEDDGIKTAVFAVQSYAESLLDAVYLNEKVKTAMSNMIELDEICKVELNSDYNFTDTATKRYRYQAVFDITHY